MELALVLPAIVMLALLIVQVALVATDALLVHHAAREAARAGAVEPESGVATAAAVGAAGLDSSRLAVVLSGGRSRGDALSVQVRYSSPTGVPLVGSLIGDVDLSATVTMRVE